MRTGKLFPCWKKNESQLLPHTIQQFEMDHKTKYKSKNQKTSIKKNMGTYIYNLDKTHMKEKKLINWISPKLKVC